MAKLEVDKSRCMACGFCYSVDEEHFAPDDSGFSEAISQDNLDSSLVEEAVDGCPTNAISLDKTA